MAFSTKENTKKNPQKQKSKDEVVENKKRNIEAHKIILKPLLTEKITDMSQDDKYVFEVAKKANKSEVKKAVENEFDVNVESIRTISVKGKRVRYGRTSGKQKDWKKAIVFLKKGQKIEIYHGI